jgi:hypothetical protein
LVLRLSDFQCTRYRYLAGSRLERRNQIEADWMQRPPDQLANDARHFKNF